MPSVTPIVNDSSSALDALDAVDSDGLPGTNTAATFALAMPAGDGYE